MGPDESTDDGLKSISAHEFFEGMRKTKLRHTTLCNYSWSLPEVFERAAKQAPNGISLLYSALSSSYYAAGASKADMVREKYPDFETYCNDNGAPSSAAQLLGLEAVISWSRQKRLPSGHK